MNNGHAGFLDRYLLRIGYTESVTPDLRALRTLVRLHTQSIPFENLNPFLGLPVDLDPDALAKKLIEDGRGGYCFEQNLLLKRVLEEIGFGVVGLAARVLWNSPSDVITPRGHMLLLVEVDDVPFIVDVGFGGQTLTAPLRLDQRAPQETPHGPFRLDRSGDAYTLLTRIGGEWKPVYGFDLTEQFPVDYEITNWYLSNHPESHFVKGIVAAIALPDRRVVLRKNQLATHWLNGTTDRTEVTSSTEVLDALNQQFGIRLPDRDRLRERIEAMIAEHAPVA